MFVTSVSILKGSDYENHEGCYISIMHVVWLSHVPIVFAGMKEAIKERNPVNILNVLTSLFVTGIF